MSIDIHEYTYEHPVSKDLTVVVYDYDNHVGSIYKMRSNKASLSRCAYNISTPSDEDFFELLVNGAIEHLTLIDVEGT